MTAAAPPEPPHEANPMRPGAGVLHRLAAAARISAVAGPPRSVKLLALLGAMTLVLAGSSGPISGAVGQAEVPPSNGSFEFRGISYPSFRDGNYATADSTAALAELAKTGANFVAIIPTRFSKTIHESVFAATDRTESDANVMKAIQDSSSFGLKVLLKPHVDPSDGKPRSDYAPTDVDAWFRNYEGFLLHYAAMAEAAHVEMFGIGCELDTMVAPRYRDRWLGIIRSVRAVYHGPLVYAHGWPGVAPVGFWDAVDYIGIDAYDPLSDARNPSVAQLADGWSQVSSNPWVAARSNRASPLENYRKLWLEYHKPVIFTEIGYKAVAGDATRPGDWQWNGALDLALQARAYEAFFDVWSKQAGWMRGAFLWAWAPMSHPEQTIAGRKDYTPQNKPAAAVITRWYHQMATGTVSSSSPAKAPPP